MLFAAVLSGGLSSRMGEDKAELALAGKSLLTRAIQLLNEIGSDVVLVSGRSDLPQSVPDLLPHTGPPGGLYSLLSYINTTHGLDGSRLLIIPVDMPLLTAESISSLLTIDTDSNCYHFEGEVFPCVMKVTEALYAHVKGLFAQEGQLGGRRSMKGIMAYLEAEPVPKKLLSKHEFLNANTPQDWQDIQALVAAKSE